MAQAQAAARTAAEPVRGDTVAPFDLRPDLAGAVEALGLAGNVRDFEEQGYTIVRDIATPDFTARLRETCMRLANETQGARKGASAGMLLGRDSIFEEVILNPKILALVEVMCGQGALLSQMLGTVRGQGAPELGLHADQNWLPAPFPVHNQLLTMCWTMEEFTREGGATKVVPGTHVHRRHPDRDEIAAQAGAIPIECPANSLACWDGSVWHGNCPRTLPGERVVLHITFSRLALRPVENYAHLDEDWLASRDPRFRQILGREDFLGRSDFAGPDYSRVPQTFVWTRGGA